MKSETQTGVFNLVDDRRVFGCLTIAGEDSEVTLFADQQFPPVPEGYRYLTGDLHNGECVTLINCVLEKITYKSISKNEFKCSASVFPNTIATGPRHVPIEVKCVNEITVALKDAHSVFYDFDAFSTIIDPKPFSDLIKQDKERIRPIEVGEHPIIGYFSGRFEIASVHCALGEINARHRVSEKMGGPRGWGLNSQIVVSLRFHECLTFKDAMQRQHALIRFFELIIGREQSILSVEIRLDGQINSEPSLKIIEAYAPRSKFSDEDDSRSPAPCDVLLCTADGPEEFCQVAARYFEFDDERLDARSRFTENLRQGRSYTIDRIVSAANIFDIFPDSAYPDRIDLSNEVKRAREVARQEFKALPISIERDSVLQAIGRMGELSLKRKVLYRLQVAKLQNHFEGIDSVLKEAINCRNHYVHGSRGRIDYAKNFDVVIFFTNALEFVFGVSDLVDCGWSFEGWVKDSPQESHPFGEFRLRYRDCFKIFEDLLA